jgi:hypothetical protein
MVTPEKMGERYDAAEAAMDQLGDRIGAAKLDVLIVVGDDQTELFRTTNNPSFAIYYGDTIRNAKSELADSDGWYKKARMARQEPGADRDYPVRSDMAKWLIRALCDRDFDIAAMDGLERGQFEGHAFSFIHRRYLQGTDLPVIPLIVNTFDPPNQPTPRRCVQLGAALRELIEAYPADLRVGVLASGGLSARRQPCAPCSAPSAWKRSARALTSPASSAISISLTAFRPGSWRVSICRLAPLSPSVSRRSRVTTTVDAKGWAVTHCTPLSRAMTNVPLDTSGRLKPLMVLVCSNSPRSTAGLSRRRPISASSSGAFCA